MTPEKLARMANEVAGFFRAYPEEQACAGIRDHLVAFWTPKMRSGFLAFARAGGAGLDPLVAQALRNWPDAESPVARATAPAEAVGQGASDAG